jgi:HEAT repeats
VAKVQAEAPRLAGIRLGPGLGLVLYCLLLGSAGLAFFGKEFPGRLPGQVERITPFVFGAFVALFAAYRFGLVSLRKYSGFKAFFQVGLAVVLFLLLLPSARASFGPSPTYGLADDFADPNPRVRALAAEVARYRPDRARYASALVTALEDEDPEVRAQAHRSLVQIAGLDLGAPESPGGLKRWRERFP